MRLPANANTNLLLLPLSALLLLFSVGHALPAIIDPLLSSSFTSPPRSIANVAGQVKCSTNAACIALGQPLLRPKIKRQDSASASQVFTYTGSVQSFLPPVAGTYFISVSAAQGGNGIQLDVAPGTGGLGAQVNATYQLAEGDVVDIYVGQQGVDDYAAGGGGGSFVYLNDAILVASGGGSGGSGYGPGRDAGNDLSGNGQDGEGPSAGAGGTDGNGGGQATYDYDGDGQFDNGGAGAGIVSNGADGAGQRNGNGGMSKAGGFGGGSANFQYSGAGGYGGGGGAGADSTGAGGGYSGGGGGSGAPNVDTVYYRGGPGGSWASQAGRVVEPVVSLHGGGGDGLVVIYQVL